MNYPKVTVIIVNWNKKGDVLNLLNSLKKIDYDNYEVIVVDNASTDGSDQAIKDDFPNVNLLCNKENLGGTGGFNTGIRHAISNMHQEYIWLLDNDAEVTKSTLRTLVKVMDNDKSIGIAGSCIMSPENHDLIVEAGSKLDWKTGTCKPYLRYRDKSIFHTPEAIDIDIVAACSALVRESVIRSIGLMDERFFLHWDDIEFCFRIKDAGCRVVSVPASHIYHGAEKGYSPVTLYYDFRNALLFFAIHGRRKDLKRIYHRILQRYLTSRSYMWLIGRQVVASYIFTAVDDFCMGRFGRTPIPPQTLSENTSEFTQVGSSVLADKTRILVFAVGAYEDVLNAIDIARKEAPCCCLTVAAASDRANMYRLPTVTDVITYDLFRDGFIKKLKLSVKIVKRRFQLGITAGRGFTVPYAFLLPRNLIFDSCDGFTENRVSLKSFWKPLLSIFLGKASTLTVLRRTLEAAKKIRLAENLNLKEARRNTL